MTWTFKQMFNNGTIRASCGLRADILSELKHRRFLFGATCELKVLAKGLVNK